MSTTNMQNKQVSTCFSDFKVVELAPLTESYVNICERIKTDELDDDFFGEFFDEVHETSSLSEDFFDDFFEEIDEASALPDDFFEGFFDEVYEASSLPDDFFEGFFEEVSSLATTEKVKVRKILQVKNISETHTDLDQNETRKFLFDPTTNIYETWQKKFVDHFNYKLQSMLPNETAEDVAGEFLSFLVKKDKLKGHIDTIDRKFNYVKNTMFYYFCVQERQKTAKDALGRHRDKKARTEQEMKHLRAGKELTAHIQSKTANVTFHKDEETGFSDSSNFEVESTQDNPEEQAEKSEVKDLVFEAFASSTNDEEEIKTLFAVFTELHVKNFKSEAEWAEDWGIEVKELKSLKTKVKASLRKSQALREIYT